MGKCWNCFKEITLNEKEVRCDNCGKKINYQCHNCHKWFSIYDDKIKERRKECGVCGFFICPTCGVCGINCQKDLWNTEIMKILAPKIRYDNIPTLKEKVNKLLLFIEEIKLNREQKSCPRNVPISYAKQRIKSFIVRTAGYRCKSDLDIRKFKERVEEIMNIPLGIQLTINQSREEGSYGQEYRDAFNYCICLGKLKEQKVKKDIDGEEKEFYVYRRVEDGSCPLLDLNELIIKFCPKCKEKYSLEKEFCDKTECVNKKGKYIGQNRKLKLKISNKDICQLNRGSFKRDDARRKNLGNN